MNQNHILLHIIKALDEQQQTVDGLLVEQSTASLLKARVSGSWSGDMFVLVHFDGVLFHALATTEEFTAPNEALVDAVAGNLPGRYARALNFESAIEFVLREETELDAIYQRVISDAMQTAIELPWDGSDVYDLARIHLAPIITPGVAAKVSYIDMRIAWETAYMSCSKKAA